MSVRTYDAQPSDNRARHRCPWQRIDIVFRSPKVRSRFPSGQPQTASCCARPIHPCGLGSAPSGAGRPLFARTEVASRSEPSRQPEGKDCRKDETTPARLRGPGWLRYRHARADSTRQPTTSFRLGDSGVPTISLAGAKRPRHRRADPGRGSRFSLSVPRAESAPRFPHPPEIPCPLRRGLANEDPFRHCECS